MSQVKKALKKLIQGENDAVSLYKQFSIKAKSEGYINISILFDALVMAERIHIKNHFNALGEEFTPIKSEKMLIGTTLENLLFSFTAEIKENKKLYPKLIKSITNESKSEYGKVAKLSMIWAKLVEKQHAKLLKIAYKSLTNGKDLDFKTIAVCQVCGNIVIDKINKKECAVCGHDDIFFKNLKGE